jgi:hypothetical protein
VQHPYVLELNVFIFSSQMEGTKVQFESHFN